MTVQRSVLATRIRARADMENSNFVSTTQLNQWINDSYKELYDILVTTFEDYNVIDETFTISSGNTFSFSSLNSTFFKLVGVDKQISGSDYASLKPYNFNNRNRNRLIDRYNGVYPIVRYRIIGSKLYFTPDDQALGNYRIWYVPAASELTQDSDTVDGVNGWEEYIVVDCAIKCLTKEESDTADLRADLAKIRKRIDDTALNRDVGEPERIQDVSSMDDDFYY